MANDQKASLKASQKTNVLVIGVNYGTDATTLRFVRGLSDISQDAHVAVVIVDNSERTDSSAFFAALCSENKHALCVKPPTNLGYFGGAKFGLEAYLEAHAYPAWVIVANVDIQFSDPTFVDRLQALDCGGDIGVIAPSIWSGLSRYDRNPYMVSRPSKFRMRLYSLSHKNAYTFVLYRSLSQIKSQALAWFYKVVRPPRRRAGFIYAPHGSCLIFSRSFFQKGGDLNYPIFLFNEELYVAETARDIGVRVAYRPQLRVFHEDHVSTGSLNAHQMASYQYESILFITQRYFS